ncbi:murein biosynthesis integral membrane protein MurJ [Desulfobacter vibrioformis]|uniref:murein biosynthesis integral membrane protein MurJ n=1 Tax=Desulfobacter vibrioformis TaxID=34031 RepID=UPI00054D7E5A|nr:murein biosynthesis integral membrane protein MurJ [Desulfobacter vibrioformis]
MAHFIKKAAFVSLITLISRILGMIRDAVIAFIFGAGMVSDVFFIAFRPFDLIRKMMSDGILSISFIPLFAELFAQKKTDQVAAMFLNALFFISVAGALLVSLGIYFAPFLIEFFAPGYYPGSYAHTLSCLLFRIMMPYMVIIFFVALSMSVLHARGNFHVPAATPVLLNLCIITAAVLFSNRFTPKIVVLAFGVTAGGIVQLAFQIPSLAKLGMFNFKAFVRVHPHVKKAFITLGPAIIGAAAFQINVLVAGLFASTLDPGSVSYLNYAERLVQFPLALVASPVATVLLPMLCAKAGTRCLETGKHPGRVPGFDFFDQTQETQDLRLLFETGLCMVLFLIIPAVAGIMALNRPIVLLLFGRGAFDLTAVDQTGQCLVFLILGLWAVAGTRLFVAFHYALSNIRQPFMAGIVSIGCNILLCRFLVQRMGVTGLSLAVSLSAVAGFVLLAAFGPLGIRGRAVLVCACRAVFMSVIMFFWVRWMWSFWPDCSRIIQATGLIISISAGAGCYLLGARLTANPEMAMLTRIFFKQK